MEAFAGVKCYELRGVHVTNTKIGEGSYATVHELKYMGLKCAGKKIHKELNVLNSMCTYSVRRFQEECHLLSRVRHPNIVQFLGVYFEKGDQIPILVMEFLPTNLTSCIDQYGILPKEISYSILQDVALGFFYLHSQTPPIIHRDLSSNNVLLTSNMTAKVSDLGMAKIINLTPLQVSHMTQTPGTPSFMPPEVMIANPKYDTSVDTFSYGIVMIHMFSGRWPEPQVGPNRVEDGKLFPVTEAERREVFLRAIINDHPLMDLLLRCINNDPQVRPCASEIVDRLAEMVLEFPSSFASPLAMGTQNESSSSRSDKSSIPSSDKQASSRVLGESQLKLMLKESKSRAQITETEKKTLEKERNIAKSEVASLTRKVNDLENTISSTIKNFEENIAQEQDDYKKRVSSELKEELREEKDLLAATIQQEREKCQQLAKEHENVLASEQRKIEAKNKLCEELERSNFQLQTEAVASSVKIQLLQSSKLSQEEKLTAMSSALSTKDFEIEKKTEALKEKDSTLSEMSELLSKTREHLATKTQVLQANIVWKKCADLPIPMCNGRTEIIQGKVYFRGMTLMNNEDEDDDNILLCYDTIHDSWTALPPLPVKWFGLGQIEGKLVAVGGLKKDDKATNNVYALNIVQKWKPTFPQMPTARCLSAVVTLKTALVVAGGLIGGQLGKERESDAVEVFNFGLSHWYKTNPLPRPCSEVSLVATDDSCFALGGYQYPFRLNQAVCASVHDILRNCVPSHHSAIGNRDNPSMWKSLINTPTYRPSAAILAGSLLAIGGGEASICEADVKGIYMFSPSINSWIYIGDLPAPRSRTIAAMLSSTEILVIGGIEYGERVSTVYKGTLQINT